MDRRQLLSGAGLAGLAVVLKACGVASDPAAEPGAASGAPKRGGVLRAGSPPPPTAVDPVTMYDGTAIAIVQLVAEYLIWLDQDFKLVPRLAESWQPADGGKRWTFKLRPGVTFSDGTPLDAETVKASFDRLLDPASKSAALSAFATVLKAGGVRVATPDSVEFTLERPFSDFPYLVSAGNYNALILKRDYAGDFTKAAVGTGPFVLKSYNASTGAVFARNEKYWDAGRPYLDGVEIKFYADDQADLLALQGGDIDAQILSRPDLAKPLAGTGAIAADTVKGTGVTVLTLRTDQAPFDRKEVRQAVAYGLGRPAILDSIGSGVGDLGNDHLIAPLFPAAPADLPQRALDRAKVAELLKTAGLTELRFTLTFEPPAKDYAVTIQNQLQQVGITVELDQRSSKDFYGGDQSKDTPWLNTAANLVGWAGRAVPSQLVIPMVKSGGTWNGSKYANPALDAAADAYDTAATDADRKAAAATVAKILHEDVPVIIAYWSGAVRAYNPRKFRGVRAHPAQYVDFSTVSKA
ncbi:ABC transporter substrate-binding protein [Dactylosporangium fulvum]|uniref:ABC transporter substrate-binding protein n=1 Tax=Dactylosporangium fulvum TaxID=53359 RepID=A0ABY5VRW8_9ACTN|nr:ABC transporter substrate-binding protein [Dactylosporangium fulvum]UWP80522.1 ABC transporter substrate-binding protein [Dactylosporangium fulvum]